MKYADIIQKSASIFSERDLEYGDVNDTAERTCVIYNTITGESLTPYQVNMMLHCLKLARMRSDRKKADNYFDGINYLAFAAEAAQVRDNNPVPVQVPQPKMATVKIFEMNTDVEQEIKELAAKFAPVQNDGEAK
jgi:hypothetical protein